MNCCDSNVSVCPLSENINHNGKACVVLLVRDAGSGTSCENVRLVCKG